MFVVVFFFNDTATTEIYTLSLHDALPIYLHPAGAGARRKLRDGANRGLHGAVRAGDRRDNVAVESGIGVGRRSEEHTSELQSRQYLVCRLLLEKKKKNSNQVKSQVAM